MRHLAVGAAILTSLVAASAARAQGMPQLDPSSFASQLFWLVVTFAVLYVILSRVIVPRVGATLGLRADRISTDLEEAARLKAETEKAIADYEAALAKARAEAQASATAAREAALAEAAKARAEIEGRLNAQAAQAEAAIAAAKAKAMAEIGPIAAQAAAGIVAKLTGSAPADGEIQAAVQAAARG